MESCQGANATGESYPAFQIAPVKIGINSMIRNWVELPEEGDAFLRRGFVTGDQRSQVSLILVGLPIWQRRWWFLFADGTLVDECFHHGAAFVAAEWNPVTSKIINHYYHHHHHHHHRHRHLSSVSRYSIRVSQPFPFSFAASASLPLIHLCWSEVSI